MKTDWLAVAQNISECARAKVLEDQAKLDSLLKRTASKAAERVAAGG